MTNQTEADLLAATARRLSEAGYDVISEPGRSLLPEALRDYRPDAIAIGRDPKLVIEIASERADDARRVAELQHALKQAPDWRLHLVLNRATTLADLALITDAEIEPVLGQALAVATIDARAALLMAWAALEALSRQRRPREFSRPQSPARIVEALASQGIIAPSDAAFLRSMAQARNAFAHGDLRQAVMTEDIARFVELLRELTDSTDLRQEEASMEPG